jgi:hypothetical protein
MKLPSSSGMARDPGDAMAVCWKGRAGRAREVAEWGRGGRVGESGEREEASFLSCDTPLLTSLPGGQGRATGASAPLAEQSEALQCVMSRATGRRAGALTKGRADELTSRRADELENSKS